MYKQNKNPNKKFEVKDNGDGTYDISVADSANDEEVSASDNVKTLADSQNQLKTKYPDAIRLIESISSNIPVSNDTLDYSIRILPGVGMVSVRKSTEGKCYFEIASYSSHPPVFSDTDEDFVKMVQDGIDTKMLLRR